MRKFSRFIFLLAVLCASILPAGAQVQSEWLNGNLRYYDAASGETVDVVAPVKWVEDFLWMAATYTNSATSSTPSPITFAAVNSGSLVVASATDGVATLTTGVADDDDLDLASELTFVAARNCSAEARIRLATTVCGFNFGFSDATGEAADLIAMTFATGTLTTTASDAALIYADSDATTDVFRAAAVAADVDGASITSTITQDTNYHIYRVDINEDGDCSFWIDGKLIGTQAAGITTTVPLCVYIGLIKRDGAAGAAIAYVDYIKAWQSR